MRGGHAEHLEIELRHVLSVGLDCHENGGHIERLEHELVLLSVGLEVQKKICNPGNSERSNVVRVHHNGRRASRREHIQYGMDFRVHGVHAGRLVGLGKRRSNEFAHRSLRSLSWQAARENMWQ